MITYNLQKTKQNDISLEFIQTLLLKGISYEYIDVINLITGGDSYLALSARNTPEEDRILVRDKEFHFQK